MKNKISPKDKQRATENYLIVFDLMIAGLNEIKPLDKSLLDRIDALKQKADELRGEQNE